MTHDQFWELLDGGAIDVKIYTGTVDGEERTVEAFSYENKFYLRIHKVSWYTLDRSRSNGKRYRMSRESHYIKEFDNRAQANAYFKKAAAGLERVQ